MLPFDEEDDEEEVILPPGTRINIRGKSEIILDGEKSTFYEAEAEVPELKSTLEDLEAVAEELKTHYCDACGEYLPDGLEGCCISKHVSISPLTRQFLHLI